MPCFKKKNIGEVQVYTDSKTADFSLQALARLEPGSDTGPLNLDQTHRSRPA